MKKKNFFVKIKLISIVYTQFLKYNLGQCIIYIGVGEGCRIFTDHTEPFIPKKVPKAIEPIQAIITHPTPTPATKVLDS